MTEKLYYWAENLENYTANNDTEAGYDEVIEIKRLNFFIGKNNAGKSRFLRGLFISPNDLRDYNYISPNNTLSELQTSLTSSHSSYIGFGNGYGGDNYNQLNKLIMDVITPEPQRTRLEFVKILTEKINMIFQYYDQNNKLKFNEITEKYRFDLESLDLFHKSFSTQFHIVNSSD